GTRYRRTKYHYQPREDLVPGVSGQTKANTARAKTIVRTVREEVIEDGVTFGWEVEAWDDYDHPEVRREYGSGKVLKKKYTYEDRVADWWLGQVKSVEILAPSDVAGLK